jgi:TatA/E family protein of Tat protein translocase
MNIGPTEIIVVLAIALLVFGPGRLPQMGQSLGKGLREFKAAVSTAKDELGLSEVVDEVNEVRHDITSSLGVDELKAGVADVTSTIGDVKKSIGADEISAGLGSAKAALAFDPRTAAKDLVMGGKPSGADAKAAKAKGTGAGAREPAPPVAGDPADGRATVWSTTALEA